MSDRSAPKIEPAVLREVAQYYRGERTLREVSAEALVAMAELAAWQVEQSIARGGIVAVNPGQDTP